MQAAVIHTLGQPPRYEEFADPTPREGQVVSEVRAASIKQLDKSLVEGTHYGSASLPIPSVAGMDGVGVLPDGRRVYTGAVAPYGMMAERALVDPSWALTVPDAVDDALAAALPNPGMSAWFALDWRGALQAGESVLVLGATGVTGTLAVQLAKNFGAGRVIAAGRNAERLAELRRLGADATVALTGPDDEITAAFTRVHTEQPVDLVLDYVWGRPAELLLAALTGSDLRAEAHRTRHLQIGDMAGSTITLDANTLRSAGIELYGQGGGSIPKEVLSRVPTEILPKLFDLAARGELTLPITSEPLADVETVWSEDQPGRRIVLAP